MEGGWSISHGDAGEDLALREVENMGLGRFFVASENDGGGLRTLNISVSAPCIRETSDKLSFNCCRASQMEQWQFSEQVRLTDATNDPKTSPGSASKFVSGDRNTLMTLPSAIVAFAIEAMMISIA